MQASGGSAGDMLSADVLLRIAADPAATRERLDELRAATAEANERIAEAAREEAEQDAMSRELEQLKAAVERREAVLAEQQAEQDEVAEAQLSEGGRLTLWEERLMENATKAYDLKVTHEQSMSQQAADLADRASKLANGEARFRAQREALDGWLKNMRGLLADLPEG